jgi:NAD(P)-dependent dehydrogenase (short-subunit alcohol dehydrogenase family)
MESAHDKPGVALVTGAGRRIGRAIAVDLARAGWTVAVHHNASATDAAALVREVIDGGGRAAAFAASFASEEETDSLLPRVVEVLGPVNCLVNNASIFEYDAPDTATRASWDQHMQINLRAPFLLSQRFAQLLPEGHAGSIINIVDQRVWKLTPHFTSYTLSKAGLWTLTQILAMAFAPRIRVNAIGPGPVLPSPRQTEQQFQRQWSQVPLQRPTAPEEIAAAVRFLIDAPAVTGQMIALDGGQHLGSYKRLRALSEE